MQHRGEKATLKRHCVGVARPKERYNVTQKRYIYFKFRRFL